MRRIFLFSGNIGETGGKVDQTKIKAENSTPSISVSVAARPNRMTIRNVRGGGLSYTVDIYKEVLYNIETYWNIHVSNVQNL